MTDWNDIKTEYVTNNISYKALSKKHDVSYSTLIIRARIDKWSDLKREYKIKVVSKAISKKCTKESEKLFKLQKATDSMSNVISKVFEDLEQFNRYIVVEKVTNEDGEVTMSNQEKIFEKVDTKAIKNMVSAMKDLSTTIRNLYDLPTALERSARDMAADRLAMEQEKLKSLALKGNVDDVVIKLEGETEEWGG